jgi:hypothetical protein
MALGATTYKTPNIINQIGSDMTAKEGCGVYLGYDGDPIANTVSVADTSGRVPYGIIVTGTDSLTPGTYPSSIGDASLELVDQLGCVVQVLISTYGIVNAGDFLIIDTDDADGTFVSTTQVFPVEGDWIWGYALTDAAAGEQCLMRFQPVLVQYVPAP